MILIKKATLDEVPLLSLKGWRLRGLPMKFPIYDYEVNFYMKCEKVEKSSGFYQLMVKNIPLTANQLSSSSLKSSQFSSGVFLSQDTEKEINLELFKVNKKDILDYIESINGNNDLIDDVKCELLKYGYKLYWDEGYRKPHWELEYIDEAR